MNVYDFDGTLYDGDSSVDFLLFCLRRRPATVAALPTFFAAGVRFALGQICRTQLKEAYFSFLFRVPQPERAARDFWDARWGKIRPSLTGAIAPGDVIASASPRFLLEPACERLGVTRLVASEVDPATGRFLSPNCRGQEKATRLLDFLSDERIDGFYSDSVSADSPSAALAKSAWLVLKDGSLAPWPKP